MPAEFTDWVRQRQARIEEVLARALTFGSNVPAQLVEAMRYATLGGGKRMRPLLAYAAGEMLDADPAVVDAPAAAIEMIHAYSLTHDDLPCMDNDVLRRGKPTVHVAYGEAMALLAGDALQAQAFAVLQSAALRNPRGACVMLAEAAGAIGMAGGQAIDLANVGNHKMSLAELATMHLAKTGALIHAAIRLGAHCGRPLEDKEAAALDVFAQSAGLAFQVVDDVLDVEGSAATLGKTAGKDVAQSKPTYVAALGIAKAKLYAEALRDGAHEALAPFGDRAQRLRELTDWIVERSH
jgi:farnesyl diphosphate synthase